MILIVKRRGLAIERLSGFHSKEKLKNNFNEK